MKKMPISSYMIWRGRSNFAIGTAFTIKLTIYLDFRGRNYTLSEPVFATWVIDEHEELRIIRLTNTDS